MFYAQYDNIGSMYKLAVKVIDEVNSAIFSPSLKDAVLIHRMNFYRITL
jgi:hypothetical protein